MTDADTKYDPKPKPEPDGTTFIECLVGPYRGQIIQTTAALADQAYTEKWARAPLRPPIDPDAAPPPAYTTEELETVVAAANAAAPLLRGESSTKPAEAKSMQPAPAAGYQTKTKK